MKTINLDPYEYKDLVNYLEKYQQHIKRSAAKKKKSNIGNDRYDIMRLDHLLDIIQGNILTEGFIRQSRNSKELESATEREKIDNRKKQEDFDVLKYLEEII